MSAAGTGTRTHTHILTRTRIRTLPAYMVLRQILLSLLLPRPRSKCLRRRRRLVAVLQAVQLQVVERLHRAHAGL